jgi:hypothetical protein
MKLRTHLSAALCTAILATAPLAAADFSLMGSYWDTDVAGDTAGAGFILGLPFNETLAFELRATYFEELSDDPFDNIFDSDETVFQGRGIQAMPIEAGLRFSFAPGSTFRPYVGGGGSYFLIDSDFGEIQDQLGYYLAAGATVGDGAGAEFFFEGVWRQASAEVEVDPEDLGDIDDIDVDNTPSFDIDGFGVNVGVRWAF